jgi:hypothetical protein
MDDLQTAEQCKELGNALFMAKQSLAALEAYAKGLEIEPQNHLLLSNRAMVNSALGDHTAALADAQACIECEPSFVKGYFRKASAELQLNLLVDAAASIAAGKKLELSEGKSDFARLEKMLTARQNNQGNREAVPAKASAPTSKDYSFDVGSPIGEGNYTSIVCATHKTTGKVFALKLIQKSDVDRIKKRVSGDISSYFLRVLVIAIIMMSSPMTSATCTRLHVICASASKCSQRNQHGKVGSQETEAPRCSEPLLHVSRLLLLVLRVGALHRWRTVGQAFLQRLHGKAFYPVVCRCIAFFFYNAWTYLTESLRTHAAPLLFSLSLIKVNVPESLARRWVAEIVQVVAYIHSKGIVQ